MSTTSEETECPHGLGERAWCTICNGREAREKAQRVIVYRFPALFTSKLHCNHTVLRGDIIARLSDESLVCSDCSDGMETVARTDG